nr:hypothetical protein [Tanacetum cinerariifolium]
MSTMANTTPVVTTVIKTATKEKTSKGADATPMVNILDFCEEHYEDILPVMDKIHLVVVLTNRTLLLTDTSFEAETAPTTSKNRMQKKYVKDLVEIHNIKQKDGETIEDFMERFKCLNEHVPRTMEEVMTATTAFIRGEAVAASKRKATHHGNHKTSPSDMF